MEFNHGLVQLLARVLCRGWQFVVWSGAQSRWRQLIVFRESSFSVNSSLLMLPPELAVLCLK